MSLKVVKYAAGWSTSPMWQEIYQTLTSPEYHDKLTEFGSEGDYKQNIQDNLSENQLILILHIVWSNWVFNTGPVPANQDFLESMIEKVHEPQELSESMEQCLGIITEIWLQTDCRDSLATTLANYTTTEFSRQNRFRLWIHGVNDSNDGRTKLFGSRVSQSSYGPYKLYCIMGMNNWCFKRGFKNRWDQSRDSQLGTKGQPHTLQPSMPIYPYR